MIRAVSTAMRMPAGGFASAIALPALVDGRFNMVGPFITIAHALPAELAPGALASDDDVRPHPHVGIAALTYILDGEIEHRDSLGHKAVVRAGDVGWMVAGEGASHSERYPRLRAEGGKMESLQIWMALRDESRAPSYIHLAHDAVVVETGRGISVRRLAGPQTAAFTDADTYLDDVSLSAGATFAIGSTAPERAIFVLSGNFECGGTIVSPCETALLEPGVVASITARDAARVLSFGGSPVGDRCLWWNFVASTPHLIDKAKQRWRSGAFDMPLGDTADFTPCPDDSARPLLTVRGYTR
jgi:redox-sensitive bicupin YhaK (pirin superfamily)